MALSNNHGNNSRQNNKNVLLKVVILGDGGVGKSCLMNRFVSNHFDSHSFHTVGVEFFNKDIKVDGETYTLQIWDTAGQERFKSLRTPFYRGSDICMLTFALDDRTSFNNLSMWRNEFIYYADVKTPENFPFLVVANKLDLANAKREIDEEEARMWCVESGKLPYIETSAKDATNVEAAFSLAVERWLKFEESLEKVGGSYLGDTVDLRKQSTQQSRSSCCLGSN